MKKINKNSWAILFLLLIGITSCTKNFEALNTNPFGADDAVLKQDNNVLGGLLNQMQLNIYITTPAWNTQLQQNLIADVYSGYMMPPTPFRGGDNNMNYALVDGWNGFAWSDAYNGIMAPFVDIKRKASTGDSLFVGVASTLRVLAMSRVSDIYGPIIFSQYGKQNADGSYSYDSQEMVYKAFFAQLDTAGMAIERAIKKNATVATASLAPFDLSFGGDVNKWAKFNNSLRLRLAMRIVKANTSLAQTEAQKAMSNTYGLMKDDVYAVSLGSGNHPLNVMSNDWGDCRMNANMESIMGGYNDPRLPKYFQTVGTTVKEYKGIRQGIAISDKKVYLNISSKLATLPNKIQLMTNAEVYFLLAEAKLRGWNLGMHDASVQALYENGVTASFTQYGLSGNVASYLADNTSVPQAYVDPKVNDGSVSAATGDLDMSTPAVSTTKIAFNSAGSNEQQLEQIITQKWIAMFPEGQEAWSEFRRTGYPKLFPLVLNKRNWVSSDLFIQRINFVSAERTSNPIGVSDATSKLGGADNGGTRLWWNPNKPNF